MIIVTYECVACRLPQRVQVAAGQQTVQCTGCKRETSLREESLDRSIVHACVICGTTDLYVQKDFPHRLGISIVLTGIILSSIAWANYWYLVALGILMATAVLDLCLYYVVGNVLVCYRCLAQYRGMDSNAKHRVFDLAIGERYRQERLRLELLRRSGERFSGSGSDT